MSLELIETLTPNEAFMLGASCIGKIKRSDIKGTATCLNTKVYKQSFVEWETQEFTTGVFYDEFNTGVMLLSAYEYQSFLETLLWYARVKPSKIKRYIKDVSSLSSCEVGVEFQLDNSDVIYRLMARSNQMYRRNDGELCLKYYASITGTIEFEKNGITRKYGTGAAFAYKQDANGGYYLSCLGARLKHHIPIDTTFIRVGDIDITEVGRLIFVNSGRSNRVLYQHTNNSIQEVATNIKYTSKQVANPYGMLIALNPNNFTEEELAKSGFTPITMNFGDGLYVPLTEMFYMINSIWNNSNANTICLVTNPQNTDWYCYTAKFKQVYIAAICNKGTMFV